MVVFFWAAGMVAWVAALIALLLTVRLSQIVEESRTNAIRLHELQMIYIAERVRALEVKRGAAHP